MATIEQRVRIPLWKVRAIAICKSDERPIYVEGKEIQQTKVSDGQLFIHGYSVQDARDRARRVMTEIYAEKMLRVDFINTHLASPQAHQGYHDFPGLTEKRW